MLYYCGIDLHSTNHVVCVNDDEDNRSNNKVRFVSSYSIATEYHSNRPSNF